MPAFFSGRCRGTTEQGGVPDPQRSSLPCDSGQRHEEGGLAGAATSCAGVGIRFFRAVADFKAVAVRWRSTRAPSACFAEAGRLFRPNARARLRAKWGFSPTSRSLVLEHRASAPSGRAVLQRSWRGRLRSEVRWRGHRACGICRCVARHGHRPRPRGPRRVARAECVHRNGAGGRASSSRVPSRRRSDRLSRATPTPQWATARRGVWGDFPQKPPADCPLLSQ